MNTTQQSLHLRKAAADEAMELAAIAYVAWERGILPLLTERPGMRQAEERRLMHYVQESIGQVVVAELEGHIAGWCSRARGRAYVPYLFVAPHLQGHGIGSLLLRRVESVIELEGHDRVQLETPADHVRAVRFYERQGYRILAVKSDGRHGHEPFMSVRLEKKLHPFRGVIRDVE